MTPWPHQLRGVEEVLVAIARGERRILLTSPTGGGKSWMACALIDRWLADGLRTVLYTNRRLLVEQTSGVLAKHGIEHGIRASGRRSDLERDVQVSSLQTEASRALNRGTWHLHQAERVLVDEAHLQKSSQARKIMDAHVAEGACVVGLTATPIDLGGLYDTLIVAGTNSELRECGAVLWCHHKGCGEPDLKHIKRFKVGEDLTEKENRKAIMVPGVFGRVIESYRRHNPEGKPTILFGPDVAGSLWFAEQFVANGISAAHIDAEEVWINGRTYPADDSARADVLAGSRDGRISCLCNRFVLREGVDCPWLYHAIFACVFGSLGSYLQAGGRLLRAHPGLDHVVVSDHGGNWWRHGSLNADRLWRLGWTGHMISGLREDGLRNKAQTGEREPWRCPRCEAIMMGTRCTCGFVLDPKRKSRPVIMEDGELKEMHGDIYRPRRVSQRPDAAKLWERMYYRAKSAKWNATFKQAETRFAEENNWGWPDHSLPLMPKNPEDFYRRVDDVPCDRLIPKPPKEES